MRKAHMLRASSTRDICIFCATRQLAIAERVNSTATASLVLPQKRSLNSSSRAPQYASEAQVYREASARRSTPDGVYTSQQSQIRTPARQPLLARHVPTRQALPIRQSLPTQPVPHRAPLPRQPLPRQALPSRSNQDTQPPAPRQSSIQRGGIDFGLGRNARENRFAPLYSPKARRVEPAAVPAPAAPSTSRFNVNMDSRPPVMDAPHFGAAAHLRRRIDPQPQEQRTPPPPLPPSMSTREVTQRRTDLPIKRLDTDELARLLGTAPAGKEAARHYTPLARRTLTETKCLHCGSMDHRSQDCLQKSMVKDLQDTFNKRWDSRDRAIPERSRPLEQGFATQRSREVQDSQGPQRTWQKEDSLSTAADAWIRKKGSRMESMQSNDWGQENVDQRRRREEVNDRRRSRFIMDDEMTASEAREPNRRRGIVDKRARGRVNRMDEDEDDRAVSKAEKKRLRNEAKKAAQMAKLEPTPVYLPEYISVANLAGLLKLRTEDFVRKLEELGFEEVQNDHILNAEHAGLIAQEYNFEPVVQTAEEDRDLYAAAPLSPEEYGELPARPPVVTIMGHVDHGKTTILDFMRSSSVAASEFGGITQHIGAFSVPLASGKKITFLDTPGHAAFETMRARGANVTDIVVLVVAADDSVMPQTVEAIKHAQTAGVPIIVAINKIDKQQANPDAVKLDLGRHGIEIEDFGGDVQTVCVSGKTGKGIDDLEEAISTLSEMLDHRADPQANVEGWVLEGSTKKSGKVATVLIRTGTLRPGDLLVAGNTWTRVRSLKNEAGVIVEEVGPGLPVEVDGWREQPIAGDEALQAIDEQHAASVAELRREKVEREQMAKDVEAINESRRAESERREAEAATAQAAKDGEEPLEEPETKTESGPEIVSFIVKGDVSGSVEAVIDSISSIGNNEVGTKILRHGVGPPSEFDVEHAAVASGHIVSFNTVIPNHISALAAEKGVKILDSNIIYRVVENVKALLSEKLGPKITQKVIGEAEVAAVFDIGLGGRKKMKVAGSKVRNGVIYNHLKMKVLRNEEKIFEGLVTSLKNHKKDVDQVRKDTECGIAFEGWEDFRVGDKIQCLEEKSEKRFL